MATFVGGHELEHVRHRPFAADRHPAALIESGVVKALQQAEHLDVGCLEL
ncbi:MAG: hypothetical protein JO023_11835, partial [Chloroflexi bacterium]|nr:hypothetical protein [Chloroflexota bacterium]